MRQSKSSGYSAAPGSLPGCPVPVPGHSHMNGILEWSLGSHIHQLEFLPYSAAIFRALHLGVCLKQKPESLGSSWRSLDCPCCDQVSPLSSQNVPLGSPFPWTATTPNISQGFLYPNKWVQIQIHCSPLHHHHHHPLLPHWQDQKYNTDGRRQLQEIQLRALWTVQVKDTVNQKEGSRAEEEETATILWLWEWNAMTNSMEVRVSVGTLLQAASKMHRRSPSCLVYMHLEFMWSPNLNAVWTYWLISKKYTVHSELTQHCKSTVLQ